VAEQTADGRQLDPERVTDAFAARVGGHRIVVEPHYLPLPFEAPDGFLVPRVPRRRPTAGKQATLLERLTAKRPESRRLAVMSLGAFMDDPAISESIQMSSVDDPDAYVRGLALMCLGVTTSDSVESLMAGAQRLLAEAPGATGAWWASNLAWEAASYGLLGAVAAAVRARRPETAGTLRDLTDALDPRESTRRDALLKILADLETLLPE
jgi:hypothetical protein